MRAFEIDLTLAEAVGDHFLYHATGVANALAILREDAFAPRTPQYPVSGSAHRDIIQGVSLTRDPRVASEFGEVVFVLDTRKLRQRHRLRPIDYFGQSHELALMGAERRKGKYAEAEEFVQGGIAPASAYVLQIGMGTQGYTRLLQNFSRQVEPLVSHPLLRVAGRVHDWMADLAKIRPELALQAA